MASTTQNKPAKTVEEFDQSIKAAFEELKDAKGGNPAQIGTASFIVRNYKDAIDELRANGRTYQQICDAIKKKTGYDVPPASLTNIMSKYRVRAKKAAEAGSGASKRRTGT